MTYSLWYMTYGILGYSWVMDGTIKEEIWVWKGIIGQTTFGAYSIDNISGSVERKKYESF